eukprot:GHVU01126115.1.p2 GENE.GHVU01126115.1~~GHVU01126115.1.p2  ORF type:complete len:101 (-),score=8.11 GHVU01126115.1:360-662(-)
MDEGPWMKVHGSMDEAIMVGSDRELACSSQILSKMRHPPKDGKCLLLTRRPQTLCVRQCVRSIDNGVCASVRASLLVRVSKLAQPAAASSQHGMEDPSVV